MYKFLTAESVSPKHPDKLCDQISDAILDAYITEDPYARVAIDVAGGHGSVFVTGEVTSSSSNVSIEKIVRRIAGQVEVIINIAEQSKEIAEGVNKGGAGDQGIMVGYATDETDELLPVEVVLSRSLNQFLYSIYPYDGKTQVTLLNGRLDSIVASFQNTTQVELGNSVEEWMRQNHLDRTDEFVKHINPAGEWHLGGFDADAGLTGRKLIIDNYGPRIPIGGGAFSGKDPSKVDRSAAYMARKIAIDYLKKNAAHEVYVYLAYAIGYDEPLHATVLIDGEEELIEGYDLSPEGIISFLDLRRPMYEETAQYGHFGHSDFSWNKA